MKMIAQLMENEYQYVPGTVGFYFKEIKDSIGIRYNIVCNEKFEVEACLVYKNKNTFTVSLYAGDFGNNLNKIHRFIDGIWKSAKCDYHTKYFKSKSKYRQKDLEEQIAEEKNAQK